MAAVTMPARQHHYARVVRDCNLQCKEIRYSSLQRSLGWAQFSNDSFILSNDSFILLPYAGGLLPHQFTLSEVVVHIYVTGHILHSRLLMGRDIEPNSGPHKRDTIIFECNLCKKDIKGTALAAANVCAAEDCSARCHAKCDSLSSAKSYKARTDPNTVVKWFCLDHGSGNVEITKIVPDPPQATYLVDSALLDPHCDTCSRKFDSKQLRAAHQCPW